jgi:tetratricopeptide (TPR) repeat protein
MLRVMKFSLVLTAVSAFVVSAALADVEADVKHLQERWAEINYQMEGKAQQTAFDALMKEAEDVVAANADSADALIWSGIIKSTYAGAKAELEKAMSLNDKALQGSAYTSLGALFYSVPGWPVGFGDDKKAEELLKQALTLNPEGIDSNYFYGSFLINQKRYAEARTYLQKAQQAPARPGRALADSGRQQEITNALASIANKK